MLPRRTLRTTMHSPLTPGRPHAVPARSTRAISRMMLAALLSGLLTAPAADEPSTASVGGIRVVAFTPEPLLNESDPVNQAWPFNTFFMPLFQGTHIDVMIPCPRGGFVGIDPKTAKITEIIDSRGRELTSPRIHRVNGKEGPVEAQVTDSQIANDGSIAMVTISVPQTPTPGAGSIEVAAEVTLKLCPEYYEARKSGVDIRSGKQSFKLGPVNLEIQEPHSFDYEGRKLTYLQLSSGDDCNVLRTVELQAGGKPLRRLRFNRFATGSGDNRRFRFSCDLEGLPDEVDVVATVYKDYDSPKEVTIPFELTAGLGLAGAKDGDPPESPAGTQSTLVTVAGFDVASPVCQQAIPHGRGGDGTTIALTIVRPEGGILKFDPEHSSIGKTSDNTGRDLSKPRPLEGGSDRMVKPHFGRAHIGPDGKAMGVALKLPQLPAPGANEVHFDASLALLCCEATAEYRAAAVSLGTAGTKFDAGPFAFVVKEPEEFERGPCILKMTSEEDPKQIKQIVIETEDGTIAVHGGPGFSSRGSNEIKYWIQAPPQFPAKADVVVTVYEDFDKLEPLVVPVKCSIGLGLPPQR